MVSPRCSDLEYINFLIASSQVFTCTEASQCHPLSEDGPAHDAYTRLLLRQPPDTEALWNEVEKNIDRKAGFLVLDDSTLDKPYSKKMDLVCRHWSGKHHKVVRGINLLTLVWTDGNGIIPVDFRLYDFENDLKTKNDHLQDLLRIAKLRGFRPQFVMFDSWYSSIENLKLLRDFGWHWLVRLKKNRHVNPDKKGNVEIDSLEIPSSGMIVHLKKYGFIRIFCTFSKDGEKHFWATDVLNLDEATFDSISGYGWKIEEYHRGLKQFCGVERCQCRKNISQRSHILFSIRAFLRFEWQRISYNQSWFESKRSIIRDSIRSYCSQPLYNIPS